ncbi:hypothetical protein LCGC14_2085340 [marine sediment metagenome]|uniref:Uncharacterized protein n=2 Tax=marine sediment metagenome TaxID=412755 RepID=A0A0F9EE91_9ZZZZ
MKEEVNDMTEEQQKVISAIAGVLAAAYRIAGQVPKYADEYVVVKELIDRVADLQATSWRPYHMKQKPKPTGEVDEEKEVN